MTDKSLIESINELRGILRPVTPEELARAKNFVALRFPSRFQTVAETAGELVELELFGLSSDYFKHYVQRILAVTREDVQRVARSPRGAGVVGPGVAILIRA